MKITVIVNDAPYGQERTFNAPGLCDVLLQLEDLLSDAFAAA